MVSFLIQNLANLRKKDLNGKIALDYALERYAYTHNKKKMKEKIVELLKEKTFFFPDFSSLEIIFFGKQKAITGSKLKNTENVTSHA